MERLQDKCVNYCSIGEMYKIGEGCEVDKQKAFDLFKRSAANGDVIAQGELGNLQSVFPLLFPLSYSVV